MLQWKMRHEGPIMKIYDLMTSQPHTIGEKATIFEAAQRMQLLGCGIFPVGDCNRIIGVITDRDIISRVILQKLNPEITRVKDVMTTSIIFCYEEESLTRAINLMNQNRIRRILVKNHDKILVGVLSITDIFKRLKDKSMLSNLFVDAF